MSHMDICKITKLTRDIAVCLWGFLHFFLGGIGDVVSPIITYDNSPYLYTALVNLKFIALIIFIFLLNLRGVYLIRINGFRYQHILELIMGIVLTVYLVGLPYYIEYLFKMNDEEFVSAISMAKSSSIIILITVIVSYVTALLWKKHET